MELDGICFLLELCPEQKMSLLQCLLPTSVSYPRGTLAFGAERR